MVDVQSPLDGYRRKRIAASEGGSEAPGLSISHAPISALVQIAGWGADFEGAVTPFLQKNGLAGLGDFRHAQTGTNCVSFRITPDRLLIWHQTPSLISDRCAELDQSQTPCLDLTHSRLHIRIEGLHARDLMMRISTIDLRRQNFPIGAFAQTTVHHTSTLIYCSKAGQYELLIPSSYAVSVWEYVNLVAEPFLLRASVDV